MSTTPPPLPPATPAPAATPPPIPSQTSQQGQSTKNNIWPILNSLFNFFSFRIAFYLLWIPLLAMYLSLKFIIVPTVASHSVAVWAEGQGMDLTVEGWSSDVFNLAATAEDITLMAQGPYTEEEFLTADALEIDLTLWGALFKGSWVREVRVVDPVVHLERLSSGRWSWTDVASFNTRARSEEEEDNEGDEKNKRTIFVPRLTIENMSLQWKEHVPANSGGGVIEERTASLYFDDIHLSAKDLKGLVDTREYPSDLSIEARTGSGRLSLNGQANFFKWSEEPRPRLQDGEIALSSEEEAWWAPRLRAEIYLENIEAGAFARLTPTAAILTDRGSLRGMIELEILDGQMLCMANLDLTNVTFRVNPSSPLVNNRSRSVVQDLQDYRANGRYQFPCGGVFGLEEMPFRPVQAFQTNVVLEAVGSSTRKVQAVAALEHSRYSQEPIDSELQGEADAITDSIPPEVRDWLGLGLEIYGEIGPPPGLDSFRLPFGPR